MTRWVQCKKCKGSGKTEDGEICPVCKGKFCVAVIVSGDNPKEELCSDQQ